MTDVDLRDLLDRVITERSTDGLPGLRGVLAEANDRVTLRLRDKDPESGSIPACDVWLTSEQVAEMLHATVPYVEQLARERRLPGEKVGKFWRFNLERLRAALHASGEGSETHSLRPPKKPRKSNHLDGAATTPLPESAPARRAG